MTPFTTWRRRYFFFAFLMTVWSAVHKYLMKNADNTLSIFTTSHFIKRKTQRRRPNQCFNVRPNISFKFQSMTATVIAISYSYNYVTSECREVLSRNPVATASWSCEPEQWHEAAVLRRVLWSKWNTWSRTESVIFCVFCLFHSTVVHREKSMSRSQRNMLRSPEECQRTVLSVGDTLQLLFDLPHTFEWVTELNETLEMH